MLENCMKAVIEIGISVDKGELIKALEYDRDQYNKGYRAGIDEFAKQLIAEIDCRTTQRGLIEPIIERVAKEITEVQR